MPRPSAAAVTVGLCGLALALAAAAQACDGQPISPASHDVAPGTGGAAPALDAATADTTTPASAACRGLAEADCAARADCRAIACLQCDGSSAFSGCYDPAHEWADCGLPTSCPGTPCSDIASRALCDARVDCHSVYYDPQNCDCAGLGCCTQFSRCADGAAADCTTTAVLCKIAQPHCEGPYVVSYDGDGVCYEGCALRDDCASAP